MHRNEQTRRWKKHCWIEIIARSSLDKHRITGSRRVQLFEWKTQLNLNKNNWQYINCLFYVSQHRRALNQSRMTRDFTAGNNRTSINCHFESSSRMEQKNKISWTLSDNKIMYENACARSNQLQGKFTKRHFARGGTGFAVTQYIFDVKYPNQW